jgi:glycerol-3-phosphate cytidylyltransferase
MKERAVFASGCFDLFHVGHLNLIESAAALGDFLVVGVATDEYMHRYKPGGIIPFDQRKRIIGALGCVDAVVAHEGLGDYSVFDRYGVTTRVIGPQHGIHEFQRRERKELEGRGVEYITIPRTPGISTSLIREKIINLSHKEMEEK